MSTHLDLDFRTKIFEGTLCELSQWQKIVE